ncbi:hypothetical protein CBR_g4283 [Chara braunii]|uniref:Uncharacterized protein n=1 Tax=Chara braunii TaxID=69332 RepID=A0A388JRC7_CHABU|nr:hypothetical protein CBR_g4283 [Chara braunii]|eukprot:GBG60327.1 hypothetical protein CBR_g4283 [Chara braunii]
MREIIESVPRTCDTKSKDLTFSDVVAMDDENQERDDGTRDKNQVCDEIMTGVAPFDTICDVGKDITTFQNEVSCHIDYHPQHSIGKVRKLSRNTIDEISDKEKDEVNESMNVTITENDRALKPKVKKVNMLKSSGVNIVNDEKAVQEETSGVNGDRNSRSLRNVISLTNERVSLETKNDGDKNSQMISHLHEDEHFGVENRTLPPLTLNTVAEYFLFN